MARKSTTYNPIVYSTDLSLKLNEEHRDDEITLLPREQKIKIRTDKKHRGGKTVTLIENFIGTTADKEDLGKKLKSFCGTGGAVKEGEILVQGDNREKILQWLLKNGYKHSKAIP